MATANVFVEHRVRALASVFLTGWQVGIIGLFPLVLLLFPDGRLPGARWRPLAVLIVGQTAVLEVLKVLA